MKQLLLVITILFGYHPVDAQNRFDSLIARRNTEEISGRIPTYYSPGSAKEARGYLALYTDATKYYQQLYKVPLHIKLAVFDSAQWVTELFPFGYLNYDGGWAMLPAGMSYPFFLQLYGLSDDRRALDALLAKNHLTDRELVQAVLHVFSLHELGHYFVMDVMKVPIPDMFANELIATYFSVHFLQLSHSKDLTTTLLFAQFMNDHCHPKFQQIQDMDSLYTKMPVQNFKWFHANILLLAERINRQEQNAFIQRYLGYFRKENIPMTTLDVIHALDSLTKNSVTPWAARLHPI